MYGNGQESLEVILQGPEYKDVNPGNSVRSTFLIINRSQEKQSIVSTLITPEGWTSIGAQDISIPAREQAIQTVAIIPPKTTPAGDYHLTYKVEAGGVISETIFSLCIPKIRELGCRIKSFPKNVFQGDIYSITVVVQNRGNTEERVALTANCPATFHSSSLLTLKPQEGREVEVNIPSPLGKRFSSHFVSIACTSEDKAYAVKDSCATHLYPRCTERFYPYMTIPSLFTFGGSTQQCNGQIYAQAQGEGYLDEEKCKHLLYYARAPLYHKYGCNHNYNYCPDSAYILYKDPKKELYAGEGTFTLTPLTVSCFYGAGASFKVFHPCFEWGGLLSQGTNYDKQLLGGGYVTYEPNDCWNLSLQGLRASRGKRCEHGEKLGSTLINTLSTEINGYRHALYAEVGNNWKRGAFAYYVTGQGKYKSAGYSFRKEYCPDDYQTGIVGCNTLSASTNFPLGKGFRGNFSCWQVKNYPCSFDHDLSRCNRVYNAMLTFPPRIWFSSLIYQRQVVEDKFSKFCYTVESGSLGGSGCFRCFSYFLGVSLGRSINSGPCRNTPFWHQYNGNLSCCFRKCWHTSLSFSLGPLSDCCFAQCRKRAGLRLSYRGSKNLRFEGNLQRWFSKGFKGHTCANIKTGYLFCNRHAVELCASVKWFNCKHHYYTVFSYSVPWNLISGRKYSKSALSGSLLDECGTPLAYQQVNCGSYKTLTDQEGKFAFNNIDPGEHSLFFNPDTPDYVLANKGALTQRLEGGYRNEVSFVMVKSCSVRGKVALFGFETQGETEEERILAAKGVATNQTSSYKELKKIEGVAVYIHSKARNETYRELTNRDGEFSFSQLSPGEWQLEVEWKGIPAYHEIIPQMDTIILSVGETKDVRIQVRPKKRKIQML